MDIGLRDKIERMKVKAEDFRDNNVKAFIVDIDNTWYFCDIVIVGHLYLMVEIFQGEKKGQRHTLYWSDVVKLEAYKSKEELGKNDKPD